jgi:hypothetical protein
VEQRLTLRFLLLLEVVLEELNTAAAEAAALLFTPPLNP